MKRCIRLLSRSFRLKRKLKNLQSRLEWKVSQHRSLLMLWMGAAILLLILLDISKAVQSVIERFWKTLTASH